MNPERRRKERIRSRDRKRYPKKGKCFLCGLYCTTELHHLYYPDRYDYDAILELCAEHHDLLHGRSKPRCNHLKPKFKAPQNALKSVGYNNRYALNWDDNETNYALDCGVLPDEV